jgi:hypothetical protein
MDEILYKYFQRGCNDAVESDPCVESEKPLLIRGIASKKHIYKCQKTDRDFYYVDTGYFGNYPSAANTIGKKLFHRVVKNELQLTRTLDVPSDRWDAISKTDPRLQFKGWKNKGSDILLLLPTPKACKFYGFEYEEWVSSTIATLKANTDRKIVIREKPGRKERKVLSSVYDQMDTAFATVSLNSIASIESILYGVPSFASVPCCGTPLVLTDFTKIETPYFPDRAAINQKCHSLAYGQFTTEEMINGTAWKILQKY